MKQVYVYGAGNFGVLTAVDCEQKNIKVVGFIDKNADEIKIRLGLQVFPLESILSHKPYIIIAIQNKNALKEIMNTLLQSGLKKNEDFTLSPLLEYPENYLESVEDYRNALKERYGYYFEDCEMSDIGIVTFFGKNLNYGQFLQAFALQKFLGESSYILDSSIVKWKNREKFDELKMVNRGLNANAKILITGSDVVWRASFNNENLDSFYYFLAFVNEKQRRISYAASLGAKDWSIEFEKQVLPHLNKFSAISVREESSAEYLRRLGLDAVCVCDPTILHKAEFYRENFYNNYENIQIIPYIFVHSYEKIPKLNNEIQIVSVTSDMSIYEWINSIEFAEFVMTDSFHCICFCILFHKPFVVFKVKNLKQRNERFNTILNKIHLEYRLLDGTETEKEILEIVYKQIDWNLIDDILEEWRTYSASWLRNALDN